MDNNCLGKGMYLIKNWWNKPDFKLSKPLACMAIASNCIILKTMYDNKKNT